MSKTKEGISILSFIAIIIFTILIVAPLTAYGVYSFLSEQDNQYIVSYETKIKNLNEELKILRNIVDANTQYNTTENEEISESNEEDTNENKENITEPEVTTETKPIETIKAQEDPKPQSTKTTEPVIAESPKPETKESTVATVTPAPTETKTTQTPTPTSTETTENENQDVYQDVVNYLSKNFIVLSNGYATGSYTISELELTEKSPYAYVIYKDDEGAKKLLFSYDSSNNYKIQAYYVKGETKDWSLSSGSDTVYNETKKVYFVSSSGTIASTTTVESGYRYFESAPYKFRIQFPANWYYSGQGSGTYYFGDNPIENDNQLIVLKIVPSSTQNASTADTIYKYAKRNDSENFEISGKAEYATEIGIMASTIENL